MALSLTENGELSLLDTVVNSLKRGSIDTEVIRVTDGICCFRRPSYFACSYLVSVDEGAVAIDVGMDSNARDFLSGLESLKISPTRLRAILLTHWHNDHSAGAGFLQREFGVPVYYAENEKPFLTRKTAATGLRAWLGKRIPEEGVLVLLRGLLEEAAPAEVTANHLVGDGEKIEGAFRVLSTPGHTDGHVAYLHEPTQALFCGDALAVVARKIRLMARPVTPDLVAAKASALRCLREQVEIICPGHRAPLTQNVKQECRRLYAYLEQGGR